MPETGGFRNAVKRLATRFERFNNELIQEHDNWKQLEEKCDHSTLLALHLTTADTKTIRDYEEEIEKLDKDLTEKYKANKGFAITLSHIFYTETVQTIR